MGALSRIFKPITQAAAAFFRHDVALKRGSQGVEIVLEPRPADGRKGSRQQQREDAARRQARAELELVLSQLKALLDEIPETRGTLKQLVFVEHALQKKGLKALHRLPLPVLEKALEQLEGLVTNWSPAGLANLRSKMAVAIIDREHQDPEKEADAYRTAAVLDARDAPESLAPELMASTGDASSAAELSDDEALAAAYAQLGTMAPLGSIELQGELGSPSTRALQPPLPRPTETAGEIQIRKLESTASI
jgi:hypothetical protein